MWPLESRPTQRQSKLHNFIKSFSTVFVRYLGGIGRNLKFSLISIVNFYYVINKLIILISDPH
jgi:hypothetical protein